MVEILNCVEDFNYGVGNFVFLECCLSAKYFICLTKEGIFNTYSFFYINTACADGVVRIFKLEDASSKSFKYESQVTLMQYQILPKYNDTSSLLLLLFCFSFFSSISLTLLQVSEN